jgi:hypothetical protein
LSFNGVVVSDCAFNRDAFISDDFLIFNNFSFKGNLIDLLDLLIFHIFLFEGDIFNSAFNWDFLSYGFQCLTSLDLVTLADLSTQVLPLVSVASGSVASSGIDGSIVDLLGGVVSGISCVDVAGGGTDDGSIIGGG